MSESSGHQSSGRELFQGESRIPFIVPTQHPCYADHFPGQPLVPGAVLLEWLHERLQQQYPDLQIKGIASFKFLQPVLPGDALILHFRLSENQSSVQIECLRMTGDREVTVAKGKCVLEVSVRASSGAVS